MDIQKSDTPAFDFTPNPRAINTRLTWQDWRYIGRKSYEEHCRVMSIEPQWDSLTDQQRMAAIEAAVTAVNVAISGLPENQA